MTTTERVNNFIDDYDWFCRKHGLVIGINGAGKLDIYPLNDAKGENLADFEKTLASWREENGRQEEHMFNNGDAVFEDVGDDRTLISSIERLEPAGVCRCGRGYMFVEEEEAGECDVCSAANR